MNDLLEHMTFNGGLSEAITTCEFFKWWGTQYTAKKNSWLGCDLRTEARDRIFEAYLKSKAVGPNGIAYLMAARNHIRDMHPDTSLRDFHQILKDNYPSPLPVLIDVLKEIGIPVKNIRDEIEGEHIDQTEEALKIMIRLKMGGKRQPKSFEGTYHNTTPGHSKFWTLTYIGGDKPYRATWGKIGKADQGHKDYVEQKATALAAVKQAEGYVKQYR
jgi:hypothetical protein